MIYPPLLQCPTESEYQRHYERVYCQSPILTFDGISVRFRKDKFYHCFYESSKRDQNKDRFSIHRAKRIDWIKAVLEDPHALLKAGWDKRKKKYDHKRRVAIITQNYIVVIALKGPKDADFITAYFDEYHGIGGSLTTIDKVRMAPNWVSPWT